MSLILIANGDLITKDPSDSKVIGFDWDVSSLAPLATIATSVWTITPISPSPTDAALTKDSEAVLTAAQATTALQGTRTVTVDSRFTQVRLLAGTLGQKYAVANKVTTNETPNQIKERSVYVLVQNL